MQVSNEELEKLRANYDTAGDGRIRRILNRVTPVVIGDKGMDTVRGYYALNAEKLAEVKAKPRQISYPFSTGELGEHMPGLRELREIKFYVKSSSRFFLKPDIGEVFDQLTDEDLEGVDAVYIVRGSEAIANNEGDEFVMLAKLLARP